MGRNVKHVKVEVVTGSFCSVVMTAAVHEEFAKVDAKRRAQLEHRMGVLAKFGPEALGGNQFNPKEGIHRFGETVFRMAALKTHQVRLYGRFAQNETGGSVFVIGGIDRKKKADKAKAGVIDRAARLTHEAVKEWRYT
jgi:hypothetical protein